MFSKTCCGCNKEISILGRITSQKCEGCQGSCHHDCAKMALDYNSYKNNIIKYMKICIKCFENNGKKFGSERCCATCGKDISDKNFEVKLCQSCGKISCYACMERSLEYEAYNEKRIQYGLFCQSCFEVNRLKFGEQKNCKGCGEDMLDPGVPLGICSECGEIFCGNCMEKLILPSKIISSLDFEEYHVCPSDKGKVKIELQENDAIKLAISAHEKGTHDGYENGHKKGFDSGYYEGYRDGHRKGNEDGKKKGYDVGYKEGYDEGYRDGED